MPSEYRSDWPADLVAERLLGGDVVGRAQHAPVGGQALLGHRAGDAEVGDLGGALLVDQDVLGLDVAVDDVALVRGAERARDLDRVGDRLGHGQPPEPADAVLERLALDVLEDDVRAAVVLAGVDHADDVRVVELGDRPRLAAEALELVGVRAHLAVHQLDRDLALEHRVEGAVDRRHAAVPDLRVEPVAAGEERAHVGAHGPPIVRAGSGSSRVRRRSCLPAAWVAEPALRGCRRTAALGPRAPRDPASVAHAAGGCDPVAAKRRYGELIGIYLSR